jgi:hypothetical protein
VVEDTGAYARKMAREDIMGKNSVRIIEGKGGLYHQYQGQQQPQPIYLELDPDKRKVTIDYNAEIGNAVPVDVWSGLVRRYTIPLMSRWSASQLARSIRPLFERVCAGWSRMDTGNNIVGCFTSDALDAEEDIERHIANLIPGSY